MRVQETVDLTSFLDKNELDQKGGSVQEADDQHLYHAHCKTRAQVPLQSSFIMYFPALALLTLLLPLHLEYQYL